MAQLYHYFTIKVYNKVMEKQLRQYENYIEKSIHEKHTPTEWVNLATLHHNMVANFQHERLIHLVITLFFVTISLIMLALTTYFIALNYYSLLTILMSITTAILVILSIFYIKHYYFLENHTQHLYKYTEIILSHNK